ncbi:hypothetical protein P9112_006523 [Eukaryota sp. TZLM1-RC]
MTIVGKLRSMVSKTHRRYQDGEFDLDLTYVTPSIIAMGFPAAGLQSAWRNDLTQVSQMLNKYHPNHYMLFNLSEMTYHYEAFGDCVLEFGFPDHHPPTLSQLFSIVSSMHQWLKVDPLNVAVVHCKAGKGRTGVVISSYLLFSRHVSSSEDALLAFASARSCASVGVQNPSQVRYVKYFEDALCKRISLSPKSLLLNSVVMPLPKRLNDYKHLLLEVYEGYTLVSSIPVQFVNSGEVCFCQFFPTSSLVLTNDLLFKIYDVKKNKKILRVGLHTSFISESVQSGTLPVIYKCDRSDLDGPHKSDIFDVDFYLELRFTRCDSNDTQSDPEWFTSVLSKR